ncbi:MAG: CotS family spore coat protein [Eubacteriales bacterium]
MIENLALLADEVISFYNVIPETIKIVQGRGIKTVWKMETATGPVCLKRLRKTEEEAVFSINAQQYMAGKGAKVPAIYPTKSGSLYLNRNGEIFVLYQWIGGNAIHMDKREDLSRAVTGIAEFHRDSAGYIPPRGCKVSSELGRWPHNYEFKKQQLLDWKATAAEKPTDPTYKIFAANVNFFVELAEQTLTLLKKSAYSDWVKEIEAKGNLCHQDYGDGNALWTAEGICVLDLDGVTFDLPARDLRKIITKRMTKQGSWNTNIIHNITGWYSTSNPLTSEQLKVLYIDLLFPHEFHNIAKNPFMKQKLTKPDKITEVVKLEKQKINLILKLLD